jgi:hypothetical protein
LTKGRIGEIVSVEITFARGLVFIEYVSKAMKLVNEHEVDMPVSESVSNSSSSNLMPDAAKKSHCPYRLSTLLQQALTPDKMRIAFLLGAGCPVGIKVSSPGEEVKKSLIPDIAGLTAEVLKELEKSEVLANAYGTIRERLMSGETKVLNIEQILSHIRARIDVVGSGAIDGLDRETLNKLDETICATTTLVVQAQLPGDNTPYHQLASWIGGVPRTHAVEVFTSNYDLLMEQALEQRRVPYFDGFVGSHETFFDLSSMEQDILPPRWARLWKIHGSINWWRSVEDNAVRRSQSQAPKPGFRQMIYPSHLKYDESRRLPYLAMLDRLRSFLSRGQAVLVICGYSFSDYHLNEIVLQGLSGNPNAICFGLMHGGRSGYTVALNEARKLPNFCLIAGDGAVVNTIEGDWNQRLDTDHPLHGCSVAANADGAPEFLIGNFVEFGKFLVQQLEVRDSAGGTSYAK